MVTVLFLKQKKHIALLVNVPQAVYQECMQRIAAIAAAVDGTKILKTRNSSSYTSTSQFDVRVPDRDGKPRADARIFISGAAITSALTPHDGTARFDDVEPEIYALRVERGGYDSVEIGEVEAPRSPASALGGAWLCRWLHTELARNPTLRRYQLELQNSR